MNEQQLSHIDENGQARMVDVGGKRSSRRAARAEASVLLSPALLARLAETGSVAKGNVIETARIAGIMAAKRTAGLIPMCHPLGLEAVDIAIRIAEDRLVIDAEVRCTGRTGVEMEAMTAAAVAALTVYDMCKSAGKGIVIERVRLLMKSGGRSGVWKAPSGTEQKQE